MSRKFGLLFYLICSSCIPLVDDSPGSDMAGKPMDGPLVQPGEFNLLAWLSQQSQCQPKPVYYPNNMNQPEFEMKSNDVGITVTSTGDVCNPAGTSKNGSKVFTIYCSIPKAMLTPYSGKRPFQLIIGHTYLFPVNSPLSVVMGKDTASVGASLGTIELSQSGQRFALFSAPQRTFPGKAAGDASEKATEQRSLVVVPLNPTLDLDVKIEATALCVGQNSTLQFMQWNITELKLSPM